MTLTFREVLDLLVLAVGVAYVAGQFRERIQLRDFKVWMKQVDAQLGEAKDRFDAANDRMSKLAGTIQTMQGQIETRVEARFYEARVAETRFAAVERRVAVLEARLNHVNNGT